MNFGIDNQIKAQKETLANAHSNYNNLVERCNGDKTHADYLIKLNEAILQTLENQQNISDFFKINLN